MFSIFKRQIAKKSPNIKKLLRPWYKCSHNYYEYGAKSKNINIIKLLHRMSHLKLFITSVEVINLCTNCVQLKSTIIFSPDNISSNSVGLEMW